MFDWAPASEVVPVVTVDGAEISRQQFELEVYNEGRQTFYHGRPLTEVEYLEFRRNVAEKLVDRLLLLGEARSRGIKPDADDVSSRLAVVEERYAGTERWQSEGEEMLESLRARFEEDSLLNALEQQIRAVEDPDEPVIREYHGRHPEKFTEPERIRTAVILLEVDPSSAAQVREAARQEGARLVQRIRAGESFAELARMHSADPSAKDGGDMGYLHAGMLGSTVQEVLDKLAVGEVSEPVTVLEGIAVFQLLDRREATLQPFATVRERAMELWRREEGESNWDNTIAQLRSRSDIRIDDAYLQSVTVPPVR
jgi:hypothetical protein